MTLSLASAASIDYSAARMRPRRTGWIALPALFALPFAAGCVATTDTTSSTSTLIGQPIIEIDPAEFLEATPGLLCADLPGAMRSYVVTFIDLGPDEGAPGFPVTLSSSDPTPCSQRVAFTNGVAGHRYNAEIDGYEENASTLRAVCSQQPAYAQCIGTGAAPLGAGLCERDADCFANGCYGRCQPLPKQQLDAGICKTVSENGATVLVNVCQYTTAQGDRHMVHAGTLEPATPRWTSPENSPCGGVQGVGTDYYERVEIGPCAPLETNTSLPPTTTGVRVVPSATLSSLACVADMGTVTKFDILPLDPSLAGMEKKDFACKADAAVLFQQGITAGEGYAFTVNAYEDMPVPTGTATCFATALAGVTVLAKCDPLVPIASSSP
ncbi:Hypothetical protein A7982_01556 [Minicystis rosea]|nr:Hypothetical protein A7982_01556 [Minicystis rosea]